MNVPGMAAGTHYNSACVSRVSVVNVRHGELPWRVVIVSTFETASSMPMFREYFEYFVNEATALKFALRFGEAFDFDCDHLARIVETSKDIEEEEG